MRAIFTILATTISCSVVQAAAITYTLATAASGTFGGSPFTNTLVTITVTGDTSNVVPGPVPYTDLVVNPGTATVTILGIGTGTFTDTITIVSTLTNLTLLGTPAVIILDGPSGSGTGLLAQAGSIFQTYDLRSSLGPVTGTGGVASGSSLATAFPTTAGILSWAIGQPLGTSTFTAVTTPEPGALILLGSGLGFVLARRRFRNRARRAASLLLAVLGRD